MSDTMKALDEIEAALREALEATLDDDVTAALGPIEQSLKALPTLRAALTPPADDEVGAPEFPLGAIENGRAFMDRVEHNYDFQSEGGPLGMCSDWLDARNCFEHLALWATAANPLLRHVDRLSAELVAERERRVEVEKLCLQAGYHFISGGIYPRGGIMAQKLIDAATITKDTP